MAEINQEETQQELFLEFAGSSKKPERFIPQNKINKPILLSTSIEQIILLSITLILACCFVFFLGVLRGKSLELRPIAQSGLQKKAAIAVQPDTPKRPTAQAQPTPLTLQTQPKPAMPQVQRVEALNLGKPYTIQLATYKKKDLAENEVVTLRRGGYFSTIIPSDGYFEVCVGQYATKDEAKKDFKSFSAKYKGCFLRRR